MYELSSLFSSLESLVVMSVSGAVSLCSVLSGYIDLFGTV